MFHHQLGNQWVLLEFSPSMTSWRRLERPQKLTNGSPSFITSFLEGFAWRYGLNSLRINGVVAAWCTPQSWCTLTTGLVRSGTLGEIRIHSLSATATSLPPTQQHRVNRVTHHPSPPHVPHTPVFTRDLDLMKNLDAGCVILQARAGLRIVLAVHLLTHAVRAACIQTESLRPWC